MTRTQFQASFIASKDNRSTFGLAHYTRIKWPYWRWGEDIGWLDVYEDRQRTDTDTKHGFTEHTYEKGHLACIPVNLKPFDCKTKNDYYKLAMYIYGQLCHTCNTCVCF